MLTSIQGPNLVGKEDAHMGNSFTEADNQDRAATLGGKEEITLAGKTRQRCVEEAEYKDLGDDKKAALEAWRILKLGKSSS